MTITHKAYDEAWDKDTIIFENEYGYMILGQDQQLHQIDPCWAQYYIIRYMERHETSR